MAINARCSVTSGTMPTSPALKACRSRLRFSRLCGRIVSWKSCNEVRSRCSSVTVLATSVVTTCCNARRSSSATRVRACAAALPPALRFHSGKGTARPPPTVCLMSAPVSSRSKIKATSISGTRCACANAIPFFGQVQQLLDKFQCLVGEGAFFFQEQDAVEGFLGLFHELPLRVLDVPCGTVQPCASNLLALPPFPAERNFLRQLHGV